MVIITVFQLVLLLNPITFASQMFCFTGRHFPDKIPPTEKKATPTRSCKVCSDQSKKDTGKSGRKETSWWCPDCTVALCVPVCFKKYHTRANYID